MKKTCYYCKAETEVDNVDRVYAERLFGKIPEERQEWICHSCTANAIRRGLQEPEAEVIFRLLLSSTVGLGVQLKLHPLWIKDTLQQMTEVTIFWDNLQLAAETTAAFATQMAESFKSDAAKKVN